MKVNLELWDKPFNAIKTGTKKVEGRVPTDWDQTPFDKMGDGDTIVFERESDREKMEVKVLYVHHYKNIRSMLEAEGTINVLSGRGTIEEGIKSYNSIENYEENIPTYGIYAIGVKPL